tara:strand:+ start:10 stop:402 length:393 start_codon:yes stop_codon:yes gene_type:complete
VALVLVPVRDRNSSLAAVAVAHIRAQTHLLVARELQVKALMVAVVLAQVVTQVTAAVALVKRAELRVEMLAVMRVLAVTVFTRLSQEATFNVAAVAVVVLSVTLRKIQALVATAAAATGHGIRIRTAVQI